MPMGVLTIKLVSPASQQGLKAENAQGENLPKHAMLALNLTHSETFLNPYTTTKRITYFVMVFFTDLKTLVHQEDFVLFCLG